MPSTTLKLPEDLKRRIAPLAEEAGVSPHAWMVQALEARAAQDEARRAFVDEARMRLAQAEESGEVFRAEDVHRFLTARVAGRKTARPKPARW